METNSLVSEHENIVVHSEQPNKKYKNINDFLKKHSKKPEDGSGPSHTRIGDTKSNIHGGAYFVNNNEWNTFIEAIKFADVDGDADTDIMLINNGNAKLPPLSYLRNDGGMSFLFVKGGKGSKIKKLSNSAFVRR